MTFRKEHAILGILIVVLSVYLLLRESDRNLYDLPVVPPIEAADITRIEIDTPDAHIALFRKDSKWVVGKEDYPADEDKIKQLGDIIGKLTLTTLVAESKNYERYGLDPEHKITVAAWRKDLPVRNFDVGKQAPSSRHTFVRLAGDHRVFHGQGSFSQPLNVTLDDLRDKSVLRFDRSRIHTIYITKGDRSVSIVKEPSPATANRPSETPDKTTSPTGPTWKTDQGIGVQDRRLDMLLDELAQLTCRQFIYDRVKGDFDNALFTVTLEGTEVFTLAIFERLAEGSSDYPAVSSHSGYPFLLPTWQADRIMMDPDDILSPQNEDPRRQG